MNNNNKIELLNSIGGKFTSSAQDENCENAWSFNYGKDQSNICLSVELNSHDFQLNKQDQILSTQLSIKDIDELMAWLGGVKEAIQAQI